MFKSLLSRALGAEDVTSEISERSHHGHELYEQIKTLLTLFPIGKKQRYYPEYKTDIVFDTVIIAYCVNGYFVYSNSAIEYDTTGNPKSIRITPDGMRLPWASLFSFQLVVPDTSGSEKKLDYERRAALGRGRQFAKGNCISLISASPGRGVSTVETTVARLIAPKDSPYAPQMLIVLDPDLDSLTVSDQRCEARVKIAVPLMLSSNHLPVAAACTIVDISDQAMRVHLGSSQLYAPAMEVETEVEIKIHLSKAELQFDIRGTVMRSFPSIRVIRLESLLQNGKFIPFGPLDHVALKSCLMNY
ncbi:MAG: PilZ domain-containing protein [Undibacterium sp.]|nr:PilZ domain-containing protein [Undibacterium sp.]